MRSGPVEPVFAASVASSLRAVSTRLLLMLSLATGILILVAFAIQILLVV